MKFEKFRTKELGKELTYQESGKVEVTGIVVDVELTGSTIRDTVTGSSHPAFRYRLYPTEGKRKDRPFWTTSFAFGRDES